MNLSIKRLLNNKSTRRNRSNTQPKPTTPPALRPVQTQTPPPAWHAVYPGPTEQPLSPNEDTRSPGEGAQRSVTPRERAIVWGRAPLSPPRLSSALLPSPLTLSFKRRQSLAVENVRPLAGPAPFQKRCSPFVFVSCQKRSPN